MIRGGECESTLPGVAAAVSGMVRRFGSQDPLSPFVS
jgi:hypothetical protein